jgi:alpha-glucoside transport system permease protein
MVTLVVLSVVPAQTYLGPLDAFIDAFGLSGTRIPLILVHAAAGLPIAILILRGAMLAPPGSPADDALHGLASPGTIAHRVLASAGPALGAVAVLEFIQVWNDFFIGLMVSGAGASPWSLLLWGEARQFNDNAAELAAGALLSALLPVGLLLSTWRRWLVPGLTGGVLR